VTASSPVLVFVQLQPCNQLKSSCIGVASVFWWSAIDSAEIQTKKDTKTDNASAEVTVLMGVVLPLKVSYLAR